MFEFISFQFIFFLLSIIGLLLATWIDLKERIVPNKLTYSLIVLGILGNLIWSIQSNNYSYVINSVIATIYAFIFAYILWKLGVWAGGDVKLFTGISSFNPINYFVLGNLFSLDLPLFQPIDLPLFPLNLFVFSLFAVLPYSILISILSIIRNHDLFNELKKDLFMALKGKFFRSIEVVLLYYLINFILSFLGNINFIVSIGLTILLFLLLRRLPDLHIKILVITIFIWQLYLYQLQALINIVLGVIGLFISYSILVLVFFLLGLGKKALRKKVKISNLKEGDISAITLFLVKDKVVEMKDLNIKTVINYALSGKTDLLMKQLKPKGTVLVDARSAAGITKTQLHKLQDLVKKNKLKNEIVIKLSVPFAPAILIAFIVLQLIGDILWHFIKL